MTAKLTKNETVEKRWRFADHFFEITLTAGFLLFSFWVLFYYLFGPALGYFHSDCADSLIWAQATVESGEVLAEDFSYAAILPFGAPLWMVPILKIFGFTMKAQTISMCIFTAVFLLSAFAMFRAMKWQYPVCGGATFCLSMLLSGSVKLREILWEHVIYYSLGILFLMLLLTLVFRLHHVTDKPQMEKNDKIKVLIYGSLLFWLCVGVATDGFQVLALTVVPVLGAILAYLIFDEDTKLISRDAAKKYIVCGVMLIGAVIGILLLNSFTQNGQIKAGYEDGYSTWSEITKWKENADLFFKQYFTLFGIEIDPTEALFAGKSIIILVKLVGALVLLVCPFLLLARYKKSKDSCEKMVAMAHLIVTVVVLTGFICGRLSGANWRLTPFLGSSIIATLVYIKHLFGEGRALRRVSVVLAALMIFCSVSNAKIMLDMDADYGKDDPLQVVADTLEEMGYDRGYATFWNAAETTLRSDGSVTVITVLADENGVRRRSYQTKASWYDDVEGQTDYFLMLDKTQYQQVIASTYWDDLLKQRSIIDEFLCEGYHIIVFDGNPIT